MIHSHSTNHDELSIQLHCDAASSRAARSLSPYLYRRRSPSWFIVLLIYCPFGRRRSAGPSVAMRWRKWREEIWRNGGKMYLPVRHTEDSLHVLAPTILLYPPAIQEETGKRKIFMRIRGPENSCPLFPKKNVLVPS